MQASSTRRRFVVAAVAALPVALGGCGFAVELYLDRLAEASRQLKGPPVRQETKPHPLADRVVAVAGPLIVTPGRRSALAPADRHYLLDGVSAGLRRRFPQVVVTQSTPVAAAAGPSTMLELDTIRDSSDAQPAVVHAMVRVHANGQSLQSVIRSPAVAIDLKSPDRNASIDELVAGLGARLDTLLQRP